MDVESLLVFLLIGGVAGWLAGLILKGRGFGIIGDIVLGVIGAALGGYLFSLVGLTTTGWIGELICATLGAVILISAIRLIKRV